MGIAGASIARGILGGLVAGGVLLKKWMQGAKCQSTARLDGKTVVITGANTGIGKETALDLSRRGAKIVMLCRNVEKGETAADYVRKCSDGDVVVQKMDLASLESVRECCEQLSLNKIDILINNAGHPVNRSRICFIHVVLKLGAIYYLLYVPIFMEGYHTTM